MRKNSGFTLIEIVVGMGVLAMLFTAIALMLQMSLQAVGESRVRAVAASLASQQLELARNLPYHDVGTIGGIPAGSLPQTQDVVVNNQNFVVTNSVVYIDDPYDGMAPDDPIPNDYKQVRVSVMWDGVFAPAEPLVMIGNISPRGLEGDENTGTLSVLVFDAQGDSVANAEVEIVAESVTPPVNINTVTDNFGRVMLPGAPTCFECYQVSVTKSGHTQDRTYGSDEVTNPSKPHMSVYEGQVSQTSFAIDTVSSVAFRAVRQNYSSFQGVQMRVRGSKEIGRTDQDEPVYKFDELVTTGPGGVVTVNNMEWDSYTVSLPSGSSVDFAGSWPFSPFNLQPGSNYEFTMVVRSATPHTLLVKVLDQEQGPLTPATLELRHDATSYIATRSAGPINRPDRGQAFFHGLSQLNYLLTILADEYEEATASVAINGDMIEQFIMVPEGEE